MPFHAAVANMAALLRSARLLKISPSGLLHITATSRNGPPLGRLYSGALGGSRTGGCARLSSPASENASSSCVWPHAVGCVRGYALASDTKNTVSVELQSKQTHQFDWALAKLDHSVRRTGRITKTLLLSVFHDICSTGYHNGNQALLLLRSCGSLLPEVPLEERTVLVHSMWEKLQELGVQLDVSHYNALLKVYLQNEFKFSPTDFLTKMEAAKVYPNRVTYQRLIEAYCQNGDIEGASTILGFMKTKGLPITEAVFNSLVTGHGRADDIESAKSILSVMQGAGIEPGPDTYLSLLTIFAEKGDLDSLEKVRVVSKHEHAADEHFVQVYVFRADEDIEGAGLTRKVTLLLPPPQSECEGQKLSWSDDVESMAKITKLLFQDKRFSVSGSMPAERASYFLYYLFDNMTKMDVQAEEHKLRKYLNRLHSQKITIPEGICKGITNQLQSYNVPKLIEDVTALMSQGYGASSDSLSPDVRVAGTEAKVARLLKKLAKLKAEDKPIGTVLNNIIHALCVEENLQHALELKQQHKEEIIVTNYTSLIYLCCRQGNVEEALNLKREMSCKDSSSILDSNKYIALVRALSNNGRVEEAVDILKEMKEKEVVLTDTHTNLLFHTLNSLVGKGGVPIIRRLQDTIFALGLTKPSANLCSPLITAYLESKDLSGALEAVIDIQKRYNHMPQIHNILVGLVENGETELLQKAIGVVSQERGEMNMFYGLFFAFLQTGRIREARKIIETQGLRARPARIQWFAEKCIYANQMETLQQMVDMTAQLFDCDRDEMYSYILRLCKETNNLEKAEEVWTKMQEENIIPRERTRRMLADIMKNNGHEVPFEVPEVKPKLYNGYIPCLETWYDQAATTKSAVTPITAESNTEYQANLSSLCKKGKAKEAYKVLKEAEETGLTLTASLYDLTICALLAQGDFKDAMAVKDIAVSRVPDFQLTNNANNLLIIAHIKKGRANNALETLKFMMQMGHIPSHPAIMKLVNALGGDGNIAGIQEVESLMKGLDTTLNISRIFVNNKALAHIKNDDMESAVELLESVYTSPDTQHNSISFVFAKVIEDGNDKALDTLSAMAERLANHFACYRPATDLFLQLLDMDKYEEAKFMLARCNALAEQNDTLRSFMSRKAKTPGQKSFKFYTDQLKGTVTVV
ncbi:hypothetical protein F2P81_019850 [Scophthalmus maximus]|uniref:Pentacotripeptide-repeat region of PRORP domain-containing protein n=1 Tax=Scophthalmus maximus TaxID=52904 RepID=A0A6A4S3L6_SCOMX|nr:hypothetical protein F2P81_019850 [Scophthalmus maximus]